MLNFMRSYWMAVIAAVLLLFVFVDGCNKAVNSLRGEADTRQKFPPREFSEQRISDSEKIYRQAIRINELNSLIREKDELLDRARRLGVKRIERAAKIDLRSDVHSESVSDRDVQVIESVPSLPLPATFDSGDRFYSMHAYFDTSGRMTVDVSSFGSATPIWGDTIRGGLFNRIFRVKDATLTVLIDNPNLSVTGLNNISIKKRKRFYERPSVIALSSFLVGLVVSMK